MSAETLRRAASLIRERAEVATEGPWAWEATGDKTNSWCLGIVVDEDGRELAGHVENGEGSIEDFVCESIDGRLSDAAHVASWHPAVALAVADWLVVTAGMWDGRDLPDAHPAAVVARAYLEEPS